MLEKEEESEANWERIMEVYSDGAVLVWNEKEIVVGPHGNLLLGYKTKGDIRWGKF
jgi:hypothetical protein